MTQIKIFLSYTHEDEGYKDKLEKHLTILKRNKTIETWHDRKIIAGQEWDKKIRTELENSHIILLLVSVDFLNSDYCYDIEIKRALEKHDAKEAVVIPIILRKCDWHSTDFSKLQALPKNAKPIKSFLDEDEAFYEVVEGIKKSITELNNPKKETNSDNPINRESGLVLKTIADCDSPPNILHWVGRSTEIAEISQNHHKVVFISGIGGQGKSGLASHYIKNIALKTDQWEFWDWRDCQEKENRIHTKIISIITRLTNGKILPKQLIDTSIEDLVSLLFQELSSRKIIFVFDNIDAYIEFENFQLIGAISKLYSAAITRDHQSKFIFTCRSSLNDIDPLLLHIKLGGLSKTETEHLFLEYGLTLKTDQIESLSEKSYELTKGHPLWLNLIAAQARRGLKVAEEFIDKIESSSTFSEENLSAILSSKILGTIWESLNDKQRTLLMAFAEIVRAENHENLAKILSSELNYNQFTKAFKILKQLNLLVIKSKIEEKDTFELHPLVREYVIHNFGRIERSKFITLFVNFYDGLILILKPKLNADQPLSFYENWTAKIELAVNKDDYKSALVSLEEISDSICEAGFVEEYIRVANILYINIDWKIAINEELSYFNSQFSRFVNVLTEFGKFDEAAAYLTKYEKLIVNKGANFIRFCKAKGYFFWFQLKFDDAIKILTEGIELESQSSTKSDIDLKHNLALALRDTKTTEGIEKALEIFLNNNQLVDVLDTKNGTYISGNAFGNIGRCLQFRGMVDEAMICYKQSINKLNEVMNKGYAYLWLAECFNFKGDHKNSIEFYKNCYNTWKMVSPIKASNVKNTIEIYLNNHPSLAYINELSQPEIEKNCNKTIASI